jgi:hypothetical protein
MPLLLKRSAGILFGGLRGPHSDAPIVYLVMVCNYIVTDLVKPSPALRNRV